MIDAALYREALAGLAAWSKSAEAYDRAESIGLGGSESLNRCFELSDFLLRWAPAPSSSQSAALVRDREAFARDLRAFESWRASGKP